MTIKASSQGIFGLMVLGLIATTLMFLTFAMSGMNWLDNASVKTQTERVSAAKAEEEELRDLQKKLEQLKAEGKVELDRRLASERDVAQLRDQVRDATAREEQLRKELADAGKVSVAHIYGAAHTLKSVQYVECVDGAAILQPEGTRFSPAQANALASALKPGQVALLVRPGAYATFEAMRSVLADRHELQIGYLPIEAGWQLDFSTGG